jgi:hypothetical protein
MVKNIQYAIYGYGDPCGIFGGDIDTYIFDRSNIKIVIVLQI